MVASVDVDNILLKTRQTTALEANLRRCRCSMMIHAPDHIADETHI